MNVEAIIKKAESDEGLTVKEIKVYQKAVKPVKHVYGKYGTLAKRYLEDKRCTKNSRKKSDSKSRRTLWKI